MEQKNKPTYAQIDTIFRWISWHLSDKEASFAVHWLREHASRRDVSKEMNRLYGLYHGHKLNKAECFNSGVWDGYEFDPNYEMPEVRVVVDDGKAE